MCSSIQLKGAYRLLLHTPWPWKVHVGGAWDKATPVLVATALSFMPSWLGHGA